MEETSTNIYLQSPFNNTCKIEQQRSGNSGSKIHLSGESTTNLNRAKELLCKLAAQKVEYYFFKPQGMNRH
jgi:hypothetical protein